MKPLGRGGEGGEDGLVVEAVLFRDNVLRLDDLEDIELALELGLLRCAIAKEAYKNHSIATNAMVAWQDTSGKWSCHGGLFRPNHQA